MTVLETLFYLARLIWHTATTTPISFASSVNLLMCKIIQY